MNPTKTLLPTSFAAMFFCSSCIERSFLQSPLQGNTFTYHTMPVASDSVRSSIYVNGALSLGSMNDRLRDNLYSFQAGLHRSHALHALRMNYGATMAVGSYNLSPNSYYNYLPAGTPAVTGGTFFGAGGLYGGISAARRMGRRGEWRYIGMESSLFREFGDYYTFRKNLPDSAADEIDRKHYIGSLGITTEFVFKGRSGTKFGIKLAAGSFLRQLKYLNGQRGTYQYPLHDDLLYFSNTYHFNFKRNTTFFQFNVATHAVHFQVGYNYRL